MTRTRQTSMLLWTIVQRKRGISTGNGTVCILLGPCSFSRSSSKCLFPNEGPSICKLFGFFKSTTQKRSIIYGRKGRPQLGIFWRGLKFGNVENNYGDLRNSSNTTKMPFGHKLRVLFKLQKMRCPFITFGRMQNMLIYLIFVLLSENAFRRQKGLKSLRGKNTRKGSSAWKMVS